jgi:hypothetical protein
MMAGTSLESLGLAALPADCTIAVANTDAARQLAYSSNYGAAVRIAAPGTDITSTWPTFGGPNMWATANKTGAVPQHDTGSI